MTLAAAFLAATAMPACGGGGDETARERAREHYHAYRSAEDGRTDLEGELRRSVSDLAAAAGERNRAGVIAAATRGRRVASQIHQALDRELDAAVGLQAFEPTRADAVRLAGGLRTTRRGLEAVEEELAIAIRDPFLDEAANEAAVSRLARQVVILSRDGEFAIRRADRAIAVELGITPRPDPLLD